MTLWTPKPKDNTARCGGYEFKLVGGLWRVPEVDVWTSTFPLINWSARSIGWAVESGEEPTSGPFIGEPQHRDTEVLAWRRWNVGWDKDYRPVLKSVSVTYSWDGPSVSTAKPSIRSQTGFWALKSRKACWTEAKDSFEAWGRVALSGTVVEGTDGYRAECATIRAVWIPRKAKTDNPWILDVLSDRYQCPVRFYGNPADWED